MSQSPKRLDALLDLRARAVDGAELRATQAIRVALSTAADLREAEARYESAITEAESTVEESAWDAGYRRARLDALRIAVAKRATEAHEAASAQLRAQNALMEAKRERKKLELWCDRKSAEVDAEAAKTERRQADEHALQGMRR
ncbi:MAG: hypothetical protein IPG50_37710 [Myxococcales bacterium]|nr:hypothetical protein [Myxococcales bacterium]